MDRRERTEDLQELLLAFGNSTQVGIWTALPAIIDSFSPSKRTVSAQPAIMGRLRDVEGVWSWVKMPLLTDVPVLFPSGGGYTLTFPVKPGDEALIIFSARCIDTWFQSGGPNNLQSDFRIHDLSDGFALVGLNSQPKVIPGISINGVQLRDDAGATYVEIAEGAITLKSASVVKIDAPATHITGNLQVDGASNVNGASTAGGKNVGATHTHAGVTIGVSNTGVPN